MSRAAGGSSISAVCAAAQEPEKQPRKKRKAKTKPQPPKYMLQWKVGRKVQRSSSTFDHPADAELHAHCIGAQKYQVVQVSHEEAARIRRLSEAQAIGKDIQGIQHAIKMLAKRIRKAGGVYMLEIDGQSLEAYSVGKGKTHVMILLGGI